VERITFIEYGGRSILIEDFSGLRPGGDFLVIIEAAAAIIRSQPPKSVLALVDVSDSTFNADSIVTLKRYTTENEPYVRAAAVVGIEGLLGVALLAVSKFSGRTFGSFRDRPTALEWLVAQ
jgi:hypothetical protein